MVTLKVSEKTYENICSVLANYLEGEMLNGIVEEWDKFNCDVLMALIELNTSCKYSDLPLSVSNCE